MERVFKRLGSAQEILVAMFLLIMFLSSLFQVINRNILKLPISWTEEISRYSMIWMTMIGTSISLRKGMQMSVDIWGKRAKGKFGTVLRLSSSIMVLAFSFIVMVSVIKLLSIQFGAGQLSPALHMPMYIMSISVFIGMLFMCMIGMIEILENCTGKKIDYLIEGDKK